MDLNQLIKSKIIILQLKNNHLKSVNNMNMERRMELLVPKFATFGATFLGPLLTFFSEKLVQNSQSKNTKLYFLAREGYFLEKAYQNYSTAKGLNANSSYLYASRAFLFKLLLDNPDSYKYSLSGSFKGTFGQFLRKKFLISETDFVECFEELLLTSEVNLPKDYQKVYDVLESRKDKISEFLSPLKSTYLKYLQSIGVTGQQQINVVDVGYSGTIQSLLTLFLNQETYGHYLIASNAGESDINGIKVDMIGYLKEGVKISDGYIPLDRSMFLEALLTAPMGQFQDIHERLEQNTSFDFYFGRQVNAQRYFHDLQQIMAGALNFVSDCAENNTSFTASEVETIYSNFVTVKNMIPRSCDHLFSLDDDVTGNGTISPLTFFGLR